MKNSRDKLLGVAAIIVFIIAFLNALEYYVWKSGILKLNEGEVEVAVYENYTGRKGVLYGKNKIMLKGISGQFRFKDKVNNGAFIDVKVGERVMIFSKRWFQYVYNPFYSDNIVSVWRDNEIVFDNTYKWRGSGFFMMCFTAALSFVLLVIYLDVVKGISLENWFQKKVLKNPAYLNRKKK